jgi:hypothetical protein
VNTCRLVAEPIRALQYLKPQSTSVGTAHRFAGCPRIDLISPIVGTSSINSAVRVADLVTYGEPIQYSLVQTNDLIRSNLITRAYTIPIRVFSVARRRRLYQRVSVAFKCETGQPNRSCHLRFTPLVAQCMEATSLWVNKSRTSPRKST